MTRKQILLALSAFVVLVVPATSVSADAADMNLSQEHISVIRQNCLEAQGILQRVQRNDLVVRTNRGRTYDSILRLMQALNTRAVANSINVTALEQQRSALNDKFTDFKNNFVKYDAGMNSTIRISCEGQPEVFYASLTQTRGLRNQLAADIKEMDSLAGQYRATVGELQVTLSNVTTGVSGNAGN